MLYVSTPIIDNTPICARLYTKACGNEKAPFEKALYDDQQISGRCILD